MACLCLAFFCKAQNTRQVLPFKQQRTEAILGKGYRYSFPWTVPTPILPMHKPGFDITLPFTRKPIPASEFEILNPGAMALQSAGQGTLYSLLPDRMLVWVPNGLQLEKMPGSGPFKMAAPGRMPNPLYRNK